MDAPEVVPVSSGSAGDTLELGRIHQLAGQYELAMNCYRDVIENYSESPEAEEARNRLKALDELELAEPPQDGP